jgi:hypothetical protein
MSSGPSNTYLIDYDQGTDQYVRMGNAVVQRAVDARSSQLGARACNTSAPLCPLETMWSGQWKGIPSFTLEREVPMYERYTAAWQTDLNSMQFDRAIEVGQQWDPYQFMDGRQMFAQYLGANALTTLSFGRDNYMRQVHDISTSKIVQGVDTPCQKWT